MVLERDGDREVGNQKKVCLDKKMMPAVSKQPSNLEVVWCGVLRFFYPKSARKLLYHQVSVGQE